jgi:glutaminase
VIAIELNADRTMNPLVNAGAMATTSLASAPTASLLLPHPCSILSR